MTKIEVGPLDIDRIKKRIVGRVLIDIEINLADKSVNREDSDECILHFDDGSELNIYGDGNGSIFIEED